MTNSVAGSARRALGEKVAEALDDLVAALPDGDARSLPSAEVTTLTAYDVRTAAQCQALLAAPTDDFVPSPAMVTRSLALTAGRRLHLHDHSVLAAMRSAMSEALTADRWPGTFLQDQPRDVRALSAAKATTWLVRTLDLLQTDTLGRWPYDQPLAWTYPGKGLRFRARLDLRTPPKHTEPLVPVLIVATTDDDTMASVAFTLLVLALTSPSPVEEARLLLHATGEVLTVEPEAMVDKAIDAARNALVALVRGAPSPATQPQPPEGLSRRPSLFGCQRCPWLGCPDRYDHRAAVWGGVRLEAQTTSL